MLRRSSLRVLMAHALEWALGFYRHMQKERLFGLAAETAFWLFFSLIPLAAVAGLLAARLSIDHWDQLVPILNALPSEPRQLIATELMEVSRWNGGTVGLWGALVFAWLASSGIHAMFDALATETRTERSWLRKRGLALLTCLGLSVAVSMLAVLGPGLEEAPHLLERTFPSLDTHRELTSLWGHAVRLVLGLGVAFVYVSSLYFVGIPEKARRRMPVFPGAIVAVALQSAFTFGYSSYLARFGTGSAYSAGLAIIGFTLTGLYLFAIALLTGALVNFRLGGGRLEDEGMAPRSEAHSYAE